MCHDGTERRNSEAESAVTTPRIDQRGVTYQSGSYWNGKLKENTLVRLDGTWLLQGLAAVKLLLFLISILKRSKLIRYAIGVLSNF